MNLVLYHAHCQDGFFSSYLAWKNFGYKDTEYIPISHRPIIDMEAMASLKYLLKETNKTIDQCKETNLYVFDFCFPSSFLEVYKDFFKSIFIIDHHETVFNDLLSCFDYSINNKGWYVFQVSPNTQVNIANNECAAKMVYRHFHSDLSVPWYIELINDRDLGKHHFEHTDLFYHGLTIYKPFKFEDIDYLVNTDFQDILELGKLIERNRLDIVKIICENIISINCEYEDKIYKGAFINTDLSNSSDVGNYVLLCLDKYDFCVIFNIKDNKTAHCSIRSNHSFNSTLISKKFNGGGHKTSAGFSISLDKLSTILNKELISLNHEAEYENTCS